MTKDEVIGHMLSRIGEKYTADPNKCWTFVRDTYAKLGIVIPEAPSGRRCFRELKDPEERQPLDLAYFISGPESRHVGVLLDRHTMIHAADNVYGLCTQRLAVRQPESYLRYQGAGEVPE